MTNDKNNDIIPLRDKLFERFAMIVKRNDIGWSYETGADGKRIMNAYSQEAYDARHDQGVLAERERILEIFVSRCPDTWADWAINAIEAKPKPEPVHPEPKFKVGDLIDAQGGAPFTVTSCTFAVDAWMYGFKERSYELSEKWLTHWKLTPKFKVGDCVNHSEFTGVGVVTYIAHALEIEGWNYFLYRVRWEETGYRLPHREDFLTLAPTDDEIVASLRVNEWIEFDVFDNHKGPHCTYSASSGQLWAGNHTIGERNGKRESGITNVRRVPAPAVK